MNEKFPSCFSWYYDPIIKLTDNEISELQKSDYFKQYLHTDYWKSVRNKFFEKFDKICHECPSGTENQIIQLHHKGYTFDYNSNSHKLIFGRERYSDLMPLCQKHHQEKHLRTQNGDRVTSSSMKTAKVRYAGFYIGKYLDESEVGIHLILTVNKGIKQNRFGFQDALRKVNKGPWYSIYDWKELTLTQDEAENFIKKYDEKSQAEKKNFLINKGISEKDIDACLKAGFVPKNKNFEDYYDLLEETN